MEIYLPLTTASILVALSALCAVAAFLIALSLLDTHERAAAEDAAWSIWYADGDESPVDDDGLPPLADALAWFALPATPRDVPAIPPQARVVARCDCNASVSVS
ncbi:MAG TPA: hypothetical protein VFN78_12675, partial [Ktedonobacterales bacterium]|nr:hypothetical protein [Ktedonobacterales bacterium]